MLTDDTCIRLYNTNGQHKLSLLICPSGNEIDLCLPNGKVLYCGVQKDLVELICAEMIPESLK